MWALVVVKGDQIPDGATGMLNAFKALGAHIAL